MCDASSNCWVAIYPSGVLARSYQIWSFGSGKLHLPLDPLCGSELHMHTFYARPNVDQASPFAFFIPHPFCSPLTWVPRLIPETSSQSVTMGDELCFLFYFSTCSLAWSVIECFQTSTSYFYFWFLFSKLVLSLTVLLSHDFSTLYAALRGPTSCRTIQLDVVQRLPPMQNTPRFLRRRLQPQPYSRTSASTPVQLTWTPFTPYRLSCLHRSPHSYA